MRLTTPGPYQIWAERLRRDLELYQAMPQIADEIAAVRISTANDIGNDSDWEALHPEPAE